MAIQGLILPPNYFRKLEDEKEKASLIYLLGPIKGAPKWHEKAIRNINSYNSGIYVASPSVRLNAEYVEGIKFFISRSKEENDEWEKYHMNRAQKKGSILFWFPKEERHVPFKIYSESALINLGRFSILNREKKAKIAVGIEQGFFGEEDLRGILRTDDPDIKIFSTLEETCKEAIILAGK